MLIFVHTIKNQNLFFGQVFSGTPDIFTTRYRITNWNDSKAHEEF